MLPYIFAEKKAFTLSRPHGQRLTACRKQLAVIEANRPSAVKIPLFPVPKAGKDIVNECARRVNIPYVTEHVGWAVCRPTSTPFARA